MLVKYQSPDRIHLNEMPKVIDRYLDIITGRKPCTYADVTFIGHVNYFDALMYCRRELKYNHAIHDILNYVYSGDFEKEFFAFLRVVGGDTYAVSKCTYQDAIIYLRAKYPQLECINHIIINILKFVNGKEYNVVVLQVVMYAIKQDMSDQAKSFMSKVNLLDIMIYLKCENCSHYVPRLTSYLGMLT
jgi:hypothetical protein